jgi:hypothetical protein
LLEAPAAKAVEAKVAAVVADFNAITANVPAIGEGCFKLW